MAVRFFSKSTIAQGSPRSSKVWDQVAATSFSTNFLVVAGGGGGGMNPADNGQPGGGGAGGLLSSVTATGGGGSLESAFQTSLGTSYTVTVGSGGLGGIANQRVPANGSNSSIIGDLVSITSIGGGYGVTVNTAGSAWVNASSGGSGGGGGPGGSAGGGTTGQGFAGSSTGGSGVGGSGGGAGATVSGTTTGGTGVGVAITGSTVTYATGGHGGRANGSTGASGGNNTGNGGGAGGSAGGNGGSGIVILQYPSARTITIGAGLTGTTATVGANKVTTFTAGTGTVSFA